MANPKVSIIIPVFNGANYLSQAIDSALGQTYPDCEVIVVNDGSQDDGATERIALSYGNRIFYYTKDNGGVSSALNFGIARMTGEYLAWLSHDDLFHPDKIRLQIEFVGGRTDIVAYGDFEIIGNCSQRLGVRRERKVSSGLFKYYLIFSHPIHGCTTLIPKGILDAVGGFDELLRTVQDYDLWYRIAKNYEFIHQDVILAGFRMHESQGSVTVRPECLREYSRFYWKCFEELTANWVDVFVLSKLTFCMRSAIAFRNIGCSELDAHATDMALTLLRSRRAPLAKSDLIWLPLFYLHMLQSAFPLAKILHKVMSWIKVR